MCDRAYGNEKEVGKGLQRAIKASNGKLSRKDFFVRVVSDDASVRT